MFKPDPVPAALLAWAARCHALGMAPDLLAGALGTVPATLDELEAATPGPAADPGDPEARRLAILAAAVDQLLAQGRVAEAARLHRSRRPGAAGRAAGGAAASPAERRPDGRPERSEAAALAAVLDEAGAEGRAEWDALGYESWVVPPGRGRRPLASLTAEWVCPADRWRVLEELTRVEDPAERARVLDHFRRAGLDPAADHPAYAGAVNSASASTPPPSNLPPSSSDPAVVSSSGPLGLSSSGPFFLSSSGSDPRTHLGGPVEPGHDKERASSPPCHGRGPTRPSSLPLSSSGPDPRTHPAGPLEPGHDKERGPSSGPLPSSSGSFPPSSSGSTGGSSRSAPVPANHGEETACRSPSSAATGPRPGHPDQPHRAEPPPPSDGRNPLLVTLGEEAEAYHGAGHRRRAAEAWLRHARELGVPVPPHAVLPEALEPVTAASPAGEPGPLLRRESRPFCPTRQGRPSDPRPEDPGPDPAEATRCGPAALGPRPPEPSVAWPWSAGDGEPAAATAEREARAPRPAPAGKTTHPRTPAAAAPPPAGGGHDAADHPAGHLVADAPRRTRARKASASPSPASAATPRTRPAAVSPPPHPTPVVHAQEPLTPYRLARIRGDYPWWL